MILAVIQARLASTRLPGKMMFPLADAPVLNRVVRRVAAAESIDDVVVATTSADHDDVLARSVQKTNARVYRGSETDVLGRMYGAAVEYDPTVVVRIAGDRPLVPPACIDTVVRELEASTADYVSNVLDRTFPRGFEVEAFSFDSFRTVERCSETATQREHVTPYYRQHQDEFDCINVTSADVFDDPALQGRTELRLTLDEAPDYELLRRVYDGVTFQNILPARRAIEFVDAEGLATLNADVTQKSI